MYYCGFIIIRWIQIFVDFVIKLFQNQMLIDAIFENNAEYV